MKGRLALGLVLALSVLVAACGGDGAGPTDDGETEFGFNETTNAEKLANELLADSGATFIRIALNWATVEPQEGERNFAPYDAINDALEANGLKPLWVVTSAPCWAAGVPCDEQVPSLAPDAKHVDSYADFTAEVAERYPDALGIEVWNEPNIPNFWKPTPDPELYRELLAATADAVHESGSEVPVVLSGPSPTGAEQVAEDPSKVEFTEFIREVMAEPDPPDVDAIALHPYGLLKDGDPVETSIDLYEQGRAVASEVAPEVPLWVTEIGLSTEGKGAVSPEEQRDGVNEIVSHIAADGIPVVVVHRFFDDPSSPLRFERGFGVIDGDGKPKPAFCAAADALGVTCEP